MNKIKTLYDVVEAMRAQDKFAGKGRLQVTKDGEPVFEAEKTFEKDLAAGTMKGKIKTEVNHEGVKLKNESEFEFDKAHFGRGCGGPHKMGMRRHMHMHRMHQQDCGGQEMEGRHGLGRKQGGMMKHKLSKIAFVLDTLNRLDISEAGDGVKTLKLETSMKDLPEDMKQHMKIHMAHKKEWAHGKHFDDIESLENVKVDLVALVDDLNRLKSLDVNITGSYLDEDQKAHTIQAKGALAL